MQERGIADFGKARANLYESFAEAAKGIKPIETDTHILQVADVAYDDADDEAKHPERYDYDAQTQAVYGRKTLGRRLRGTWQLVNKSTGAVEDQQRRSLAVVPRVNEDGLMIYRGTRYAMQSQTRVKPAVFARRKRNEEAESFVNVERGTGQSHRYILNPETKMFYFNIGHSRIPLAEVLRAMGKTDDEIKSVWGDEIADSNFKKRDPKALSKLYEQLVSKRDQVDNPDEPTKRYLVSQAMSRMRVDPWSMKRTVGVETDRLDGDIILQASKRVLAMSRGEEEADDRDHLAYQTFHTVEDLLPERVRMDKNSLQRKHLNFAARNRSLSKIPTGLLQGQIEAAIFSSGLAVQPDHSNPLDALDRATRVSKMGEGGLPSTQATPMESRNVHPSQFLFIDPARSSESLKVGVDLNLSKSLIRGADGRMYVRVKNARTGELELKSPEDLADSNVGISKLGAEVEGYVGGVRKGKEDFIRPEEVDYVANNPSDDLFSFGSALIPMRSAMAAHRLAMGARFIAQALPLQNRETPWVQAATEGSDRSANSALSSHVGSVRSDTEGIVREVTPSAITIETPQGMKRVPLHRMTPLGSKTALYNKAMVRPGDAVAPGQLLAGSNYTDDKGDLTVSANARIAFMPYGDNFEDAFTVSESFAKRLASEHLYRSRYTPDKEHRRSTKEFISALPSIYNKRQIDTLDEGGVVQVGTKVSAGDPLVLAAAPKQTGVGRVHRKGGKSFNDKSLTWEHEDAGEVVDVYKDTSGETVVAVKALSPLKSADKISSWFGDKGVVRILPDSEMLQGSDGKPMDLVASDLGLISRENPGRALVAFLAKAAERRGKPYVVSEFPDGRFEDFVAAEMEKHGVKPREDLVDPRTGRAIPQVSTGILPIMKLTHIAESKSHARGLGKYSCFDDKTEVLTRAGWATWDQVNTQSELATLTAANQIAYERPTSVTREWYSGDMCGFSGRFVDYLVTPNHRMWVRMVYRVDRLRNANKEFFFETASKIGLAKSKRLVKQSGFSPDAGLASDQTTWTVGIPSQGKSKRKTYYPLTFEICDYAELLGWFLAEGSASYNAKWREWVVNIAQVEHANPDNFERIADLLRRMQIRFSYAGVDKKRASRGRRGFRIRSKQLYEHFAQFGVGCENKRIPRFAFEFPLQARHRLFESLLLGDGSLEPHNCGGVSGSYTTTSKGLADDVQELAIRVGYGAAVHPKPARNPRCKLYYEVGIFLSRGDAWLGEQSRSSAQYYSQPYSGYVSCASVPSGLLIVRRNGKVLVTGNSEGTPAKGAEEGAQAKRLSNQELGALMSHGAYEFLREGALLRGQRNDEYWARYMNGHDPIEPEVPFVYEKFVGYLKGMGVNPVRTGRKTRLLTLTDADVRDLSDNKQVSSGETMDFSKGQKPINGGLFDPQIFGGDGEKWANYKLQEAIPHPLFEDPIRTLMGVTKDEYRQILSGTKEYGDHGSGPEAFKRFLSGVNVDKEIQLARSMTKDPRKTRQEIGVKRLRYLKGLADRNIDPASLMVQHVPILPPKMRPINVMSTTKTPLIDGMNLLYRDMIEADTNLKRIRGFTSDVSSDRMAVYDAVQAAYGLREPVDPELRQKQVTGLLKRLVGSSPKESYVSRKLLSGTVDAVGRAVVVPSAKLTMDEVGIPEQQAWTMYKMPMIRSMRRRGYPLAKAMSEIEAKSPFARQVLLSEMENRPVVLSRAPVLHKFGIMAFRPQLVQGTELVVNPLVHEGFNLDHDGDAMNFHVVLGDKAVQEAKDKLLPSKSLISPRDFKSAVAVPRQDHAMGLYVASSKKSDKIKRTAIFQNIEALRRALERGEIDVDTPAKLLE